MTCGHSLGDGGTCQGKRTKGLTGWDINHWRRDPGRAIEAT